MLDLCIGADGAPIWVVKYLFSQTLVTYQPLEELTKTLLFTWLIEGKLPQPLQGTSLVSHTTLSKVNNLGVPILLALLPPVKW